MRQSILLIFAFLIVLVGSHLSAAVDKAKPEEVKVDLSSPLATLKTYAMALAKCDAKAFRACHLAQSPEEKNALDVATHWVKVAGKLEAAAMKAFGDAGSALANEDELGSLLPQSCARQLREEIEADEISIQGGTKIADASTALGPRHLELRGDSWLIVAEIKKNEGDGAEEDQMIPFLIKEFERAAKDIAAGKFKSAKEAYASVLRDSMPRRVDTKK